MHFQRGSQEALLTVNNVKSCWQASFGTSFHLATCPIAEPHIPFNPTGNRPEIERAPADSRTAGFGAFGYRSKRLV